MCGAEGDALWAPFFAAEAERRGVPVTALEEELIAHVGAPKPQRTASVDWTALAAWYAAGAASTVADPPAPAAAAGAALPAVRFDLASKLYSQDHLVTVKHKHDTEKKEEEEEEEEESDADDDDKYDAAAPLASGHWRQKTLEDAANYGDTHALLSGVTPLDWCKATQSKKRPDEVARLPGAIRTRAPPAPSRTYPRQQLRLVPPCRPCALIQRSSSLRPWPSGWTRCSGRRFMAGRIPRGAPLTRRCWAATCGPQQGRGWRAERTFCAGADPCRPISKLSTRWPPSGRRTGGVQGPTCMSQLRTMAACEP